MWLHRYLRFLVFATFFLIIAGGLVTSTDSGLSVPDWPKSYGMWMPPMVGGVFYEHGHRMVASFVGFLTVILALWLGFKEKRKWLRNLGFIALAAVIIQGILGGLTVIYLLPTPISVAHATLAQTFFALIVAIALFTSSLWKEDKISSGDAPVKRHIFLATSLAIYLQLILGATVRHTDSALAIPDFPLAFGRLIPDFATAQIAIHFAHRIGAIAVTAMIIYMFVYVIRHHKGNRVFVLPASMMLILVFFQIALGGLTVLTKTAVPVATAHVAVGAVLLASSVFLTLCAYKTRAISETASVSGREGAMLGMLGKVNG